MSIDREYKIRISTVADNSGARQAADGLKELKQGTTDVADANKSMVASAGALTDGLKDETKATEKSFAKKKELKDIVKELSHEFPILGQIGRAAINPVLISSALITASLAIVVEKLKSVSSVMETSSFKPADINAAAAAWDNYAKAVASIKSGTEGLNRNLAAIATHMALIKQLTKESGGDPENPLLQKKEAQEKADAKLQFASAAAGNAALLRRRAQQIEPSKGKEFDEATQGPLDEEAQKAQVEIERLNKEIATIKQAYDPANRGVGRSTIEHIKYAAKYGVTVDPDEIVKALEQEKSGYKGFVDRAAGNRQRNQTNESKRAAAAELRRKADELDGQASAARQEAGDIRFDSQVKFESNMRGRGIIPPVTPTGSNLGVTADARKYYEQAQVDMQNIAALWAAGIANLRKEVERTATHGGNRRNQ